MTQKLILALTAAACLLFAIEANAACDVTKADLQTLNTQVNSFPKQSYAGDRWRGMDEFYLHGGNCVSFAIAKYIALAPVCKRKDLTFVDGHNGDGTGHRILKVRTHDGDYFMDSRFNLVTVEPKDFK